MLGMTCTNLMRQWLRQVTPEKAALRWSKKENIEGTQRYVAIRRCKALRKTETSL